MLENILVIQNKFKKGFKMIKSFLIVSALIFLGGCASKNTQYSGFLEDYSTLEPSPYLPKALLYTAPGVDISNYENVMVEPVRIFANNEQIKADSGLLKEASMYLTQRVRNKLDKNPNFNLVTQPQDKTLKIEFAITAVEAVHDERKGYQYIPVALVVSQAARASGAIDKNAMVAMELRVSDANTGKILAKVLDSEAGEKVNIQEKDIDFKHLKPALDTWADRFSDRLDHMKKNRIK